MRVTHREFKVARFPHPGIVVVEAQSRRSFGRHAHDQYGVGLITHGAQRSASGRGPVETGAGAIITVNPGEVHDGAPIGDSGRRWSMLYLEPETVRAASSDEHGDDYEFESPAFHDGAARACLVRLFDARSGAGDGLLIEEQLLLLLERLRARRRRSAAARAVPEVLPAKALIDDDPAASLQLADLAQACGLSRFQTLRAFSRATGLTPHAYQMQRRLQAARRLIASGRPLVEAALDSGFHDQSHMTRLFVRMHGYSPGAFARAAA